jgi:hypothetical protein
MLPVFSLITIAFLLLMMNEPRVKPVAIQMPPIENAPPFPPPRQPIIRCGS